MNIEIFSDSIFYVEKCDTRITIIRAIVKNIFNKDDIETTTPKYVVLFSYIEKDYYFIAKEICTIEFFLKNKQFQSKKLYYIFASKILNKYGQYLDYVPKSLRDYNLCDLAISNEPTSIRWADFNIDNYYSLLKKAFLKDNGIFRLLQIPKEYKRQLKIDFPENLVLYEDRYFN